MKKRINWKPYVIAAIISLIIFAALFSILVFLLKEPILDGLTIPAIILVGIALLIYISREGFFDFASYGFRQFGSALFGKDPNLYKDFADYKIKKNEIRKKRSKYFLSILAVGLIILIVSLIFFLVKR